MADSDKQEARVRRVRFKRWFMVELLFEKETKRGFSTRHAAQG
jgi:hypothetical protein